MMKKVFIMVLTALVLFCSVNDGQMILLANTSGDYDYTILDDDTVRIDKYNGNVVDLAIPEKIAGKMVTQLGNDSFSSGKQKSIVIPDSITYIGENAFYRCERLTNINIPVCCAEIGNGSFRDTSITSIVIPSSVYKIGNNAFCNTPLKTITIEDGVAVIGDFAFASCNNLKTMYLPKSVKTIANYVWDWCGSLESVTILNSNCEFSYDTFHGAYCKIISYNQSNVYEYAIKNKIEFECIEHSWDNNGYIDIEPTCSNNGRFAYPCKYCSAKKTYSISKKEHHIVYDKPVAATFKEAGKTKGSHCSVCGKVISKQKTIARIKSPKLSKITRRRKAFTTKWKKIDYIEGYQIRYSLKKNMKSSKSVNVKKTATGKKVSKLKAKKTYYVQIRAYKTINGKKVYSSWSAKKTVKTK